MKIYKPFTLLRGIPSNTLTTLVSMALAAYIIFLGNMPYGYAATSVRQFKLYNLCEHPYTPIVMDLDHYKKDEITFATKDPNFVNLGTAQYKGIPLRKLLSVSPCAAVSDNVHFIILANDQYVLYDALDQSGGILSYELNSKPIPSKYGGPLKVLYHTFPSQEAAIWSVTSIVLGTLEKPSLCIVPENGRRMTYNIDQLKAIKHVSDNIPFMLPRGYRTGKSMPKKINVRYLPIATILQSKHIKSTYLLIDTYSGHTFKIKKKDQLKSLYLVFQFNEKDIPIQWGGPFVLAYKNQQQRFFAEKQPYYYVHTIRMK